MGEPARIPAVNLAPPTVVVPFVPGMLNRRTACAVTGSGLPYVFAQLPHSNPGAYGVLFRHLWQQLKTFVVCEQDVVPTTDQLATIAACNHDWCSYSYSDGLYPSGPMFGLARFSDRIQATHPHAAEVALVIGKRRDTEAEWWRVDSLVARDLTIRGVRWSEHQPPVDHAHVGPPSGPMVT